jgi:hypothetical protein
MTQPKHRTATEAQRRYLSIKRQWTKIRLKAWKEIPERMEAARREATRLAAKKKQDKNTGLRQVISSWPDTMTVYELRQRIADEIEYKGKPSSLVWRLRRHGMICFREDGLWVNLCTLKPRNDGQPNP